jgi:peptide chain release factor 2
LRSGTAFDLPAKREHLQQIEEQMAKPGFWDDPERARSVVSELKSLRAIIEPLDALEKDSQTLVGLEELATSEGDADVLAEVEREASALAPRVEKIELMTLLGRPNDERNCYFSIQAGAGGADAQDWAEMLLRMYLRYFERNGFEAEELSRKDGEEAGLQSINLFVRGAYAYGYLSCEMGVHRLVRISPFGLQGKRETSFAAVDVLPEMEEISVEIDWDEVREDTFRASGAGGQHVNKTSSAIRLTHLPTGVVVQCQNERSQHKNRATARRLLASRLYRIAEQERNAELAKAYGDKGQIAWGNQIRSYVLAPYQMVKDVRTGVETGNPQAVLDGDIQEFIDAELRRRASQKAPEQKT